MNDNEAVNLTAIIVLIAAWAAKVWWWQRAKNHSFKNKQQATSSVASATGLGNIGEVRLLERPHSGENYLTREMVHVIGRKYALRLRFIAMIVGGLLPMIILLMTFVGLFNQGALLVAALIMIVGLLAERWLFFAEAEHSVSLYY